MKTFLLCLTVVIACTMPVTESFRFNHLMKELDELTNFLKHQEQAMIRLNCSNCQSSSETMCTAMQEIVECPVDNVCFTQEAFNSNTSEVIFTRGCFPLIFCDFACASLNESRGGNIQSCVTQCCNTSGCNVGSLPLPTPTAMSTPTPSPTPASSSMPMPSSSPSPTPASSSMPMPSSSPAPTPTPVVCGGAIPASGVIQTPGFPGNYPDNVRCVWTRTVARGRVLRLRFTRIDLNDAGDFLNITRGNVLIRSFVGSGAVVKRSIDDEPSYEDFYRDGNRYYYDDDGYADYYYYDGRRKKHQYFFERRRRQVTTVRVQGNNQLVSVIFQSNASGNAGGVGAQANDISGSESESGSESGGSSDEEEY